MIAKIREHLRVYLIPPVFPNLSLGDGPPNYTCNLWERSQQTNGNWHPEHTLQLKAMF